MYILKEMVEPPKNCRKTYFLIGGRSVLFTVTLNRRMLGLSYSSIDMPLDNRLFKSEFSLDPPELVEYALERSTPGITTDVSKPWPLQNNKIACATFDGCGEENMEIVIVFC